MSCEQCRATFVALETSDEALPPRADRLDEAEPECRCEAFSVSEHSPGSVLNEEVLVRILVAPQHMHKKKIQPTAASLSDSERKGLSVIRNGYIEDDIIRAVAEGLVNRARNSNNDKAGVFGVLLIECSTVRQFVRFEESKRCYCVYDTAEKNNHGHAEIFQQVAGVEKPIRDDRRQKLFEAVKTRFVPVNEFRGGLLAYLAPPSLPKGAPA